MSAVVCDAAVLVAADRNERRARAEHTVQEYAVSFPGAISADLISVAGSGSQAMTRIDLAARHVVCNDPNAIYAITYTDNAGMPRARCQHTFPVAPVEVSKEIYYD